jgi:glycosyltransferase involved in cell wall biosynthesis
MFYSIVVPVYNRPDEIEDLLNCLQVQTYRNFETIIVESGSEIKSDKVVESYQSKIEHLYYYLKGNDGQGFSRNYGFARAKGDYFIVLDSDILLDPDFVENIHNHLSAHWLDAYGGPDRLHPNAKPIQKAVDYCLTSFLTTGGIRGGKTQVGKFYPRSFNMGFSRKVYEATGGYKLPFFGEDIELSSRIMSLGFTTGLIPSAHVYHKRKENFAHFFKQMDFFGRARVNTYLLFPDTLKLTHFFPAVFFLFYIFAILVAFLPFVICKVPLLLLAVYVLAIFVNSFMTHKSIKVAILTVRALFVQMTGYGIGFLKDFWLRVILKKQIYSQNI